jgi:uncharacterized protein (TIGR02118 family)
MMSNLIAKTTHMQNRSNRSGLLRVISTSCLSCTSSVVRVGVLFLVALTGCREERHQGTDAGGLFKITIMYPNSEGAKFDMDYYQKTHMPLVAGFLGDNLKYYEIEQGLSGRSSADRPTYLAIGAFYVQDTATYNASVARNREVILGDIKNYTNLQPLIQINEIKQMTRNGQK